MDTDRYLQPHQARRRPPTTFEDLLGDAIERAFGEGAETLPDVVACLNRFGPSAPNGGDWNEDNFRALMARLGTEGDAA
jgi:hypothetical protein